MFVWMNKYKKNQEHNTSLVFLKEICKEEMLSLFK